MTLFASGLLTLHSRHTRRPLALVYGYLQLTAQDCSLTVLRIDEK